MKTYLSPFRVAFCIWMLADAAFRDPREFAWLHRADGREAKLAWFLAVLLTFIFGAVAYHLTVRRRAFHREGDTGRLPTSGEPV